jgi:PadR family transcriptional regulator PadR
MENVASDIIRGNIDTIILRCLNVSEMYGLEIINYIRKASNDTYILKQPTLYSALKRLEGKGFISSYWRDSAIGGRRHYYKLTQTGKDSLPTRKDQWSASKEVIDTLVDDAPAPKKKSTKTPVLPVDDIPPPPATLPHTVTMGMAINPYNPFATEVDNDIFTLPLSLLEETDNELALAPQPAPPPKLVPKQEENLPLLKYVMAEGTLAPTSPEQNVKPTQQPVPASSSSFARYLSPDDYAAITPIKTGAAAKTAKIANYDINIRPVTKHFNDKKRGDFHFVSRLRLASAIVTAFLLVIALVVAYHSIQPVLPDATYTPVQSFFFTAGYTLAGLYFSYYLIRFIASPASKKASTNQITEHFIRLGVFLGSVIAILAINVLAGLTHLNSPDELVFWAIPCILVATIYFEGIIQLLLRKTNIFVA